MKKFATILSIFLLSIGFASAQCVVDTTNTQLGITPPDSVFPRILDNVALDNSYVAQVYVPVTFTYSIVTVTIYWIDITSVTGFPTGITYAKTPNKDTIFGGNRQCIKLSGTTNDPAAKYPLTFNGFVRFKAPPFIANDTTFTIAQLNALASGGGFNFGYSVTVLNPAGINDINADLTAAMQVVPNPNNGMFDVKFNYHGMLQGDLKVIDITGREVYSQPLNTDGLYTTAIDLSKFSKGIYSVQLRTEQGLASKIVSVQ